MKIFFKKHSVENPPRFCVPKKSINIKINFRCNFCQIKIFCGLQRMDSDSLILLSVECHTRIIDFIKDERIWKICCCHLFITQFMCFLFLIIKLNAFFTALKAFKIIYTGASFALVANAIYTGQKCHQNQLLYVGSLLLKLQNQCGMYL